MSQVTVSGIFNLNTVFNPLARLICLFFRIFRNPDLRIQDNNRRTILILYLYCSFWIIRCTLNPDGVLNTACCSVRHFPAVFKHYLGSGLQLFYRYGSVSVQLQIIVGLQLEYTTEAILNRNILNGLSRRIHNGNLIYRHVTRAINTLLRRL